jgi:DNA-binding response OmpR family regulator
MTRPTVVAVFNTSQDTVDVLRIVLEQAGFVVVSAYTYELREGDVDLETFVRQHSPQAIVYDVALPYEANWRLFQHIRGLPILAGTQFVITTTNAAQVRKIAGKDVEIFEIVGKPYDMNLVVAAVRKAVERASPVRERREA